MKVSKAITRGMKATAALTGITVVSVTAGTVAAEALVAANIAAAGLILATTPIWGTAIVVRYALEKK